MSIAPLSSSGEPAFAPYVFEEKYCEIWGIKVCYVQRGSGDQTVIFLRGVGGNIDWWKLNLPYFAKKYRVFAIDLPGSGKSEKPNINYSISFYTCFLKSFMDDRGISKTSFVGYSMGGHIALNFALYYPEMVDKLVLFEPTGAHKKPDIILSIGLLLLWHDFSIEILPEWQWRKIYADMYRIEFGEDVQESRFIEEKFEELMAYRKTRDFKLYARAYSRSIENLLWCSLRGLLGRISAPTLIIWGKLDKIHKIENAYYLRDHIRNATLVVFEESGGGVNFAKADEFNQLVDKFLSERRPLP